MAQEETIREFLVRLGYKIDRKSERRFVDAINSATKAAAALGTGVYAAAASVAAGTAAISRNLNQLYYSSKRTGSSARQLKAFSFAAKQLGSNSEEARGAVEGLATRLRQSPGYENLLKGLGINTRTANGHLRGSVSLLEQFGSKARNMPMFQAEAYARQLGIPEHLLLALRSGRFSQYTRQYQQLSRGSQLNQATQGAHKLTLELQQITSQFHLIAIEAANAVQKSIGPDLKQLAKWLDKNGPRIAKEIGEWSAKLVHWAEVLTQWLVKADHATHGWSTKLLAAAAALKVLSMSPFKGVITGIRGITSAASGALPLLTRLGLLGAAAGGGAWAGHEIYKHGMQGKKSGDVAGSIVAHTLSFLGDKNATRAIQGMHAEALRQKQRTAIGYFMKQGWSRAQATGIVANLTRESKLDPTAYGDHGHAIGIGQWHPARQAAFRKWAGMPIWRASLKKQLAFVQHELTHGQSHAGTMLRATKNAQAAGRAVSLYYERPAASAAEAAKRGKLAQQLYLNTTINVHGVDNPHAVAKKIQQAQHDANASLLRNAKAVAQ